MKKALFLAILAVFCLIIEEILVPPKYVWADHRRRDCVFSNNRGQAVWDCDDIDGPGGRYPGGLNSAYGTRVPPKAEHNHRFDHRDYDYRNFPRNRGRRGGINFEIIINDVLRDISNRDYGYPQPASAPAPQIIIIDRERVVEKEVPAPQEFSRYEHKSYRGYYETAPVQCTAEQLKRNKVQYGTEGWLQISGDPNSRCHYNLK